MGSRPSNPNPGPSNFSHALGKTRWQRVHLGSEAGASVSWPM